LVEGGNVTVVQGTRVKKAADKSPPIQGVAPVASAKVDSQDQKARDLDSRLILQSELKKAEARQQELVKEFNNGEPEKRADESRNYQKYLDRVNEIKASMARNESDLGGIRRELSRLPATASSK
jgi:adenylosuccinate synthase